MAPKRNITQNGQDRVYPLSSSILRNLEGFKCYWQERGISLFPTLARVLNPGGLVPWPGRGWRAQARKGREALSSLRGMILKSKLGIKLTLDRCYRILPPFLQLRRDRQAEPKARRSNTSVLGVGTWLNGTQEGF